MTTPNTHSQVDALDAWGRQHVGLGDGIRYSTINGVFVDGYLESYKQQVARRAAGGFVAGEAEGYNLDDPALVAAVAAAQAHSETMQHPGAAAVSAVPVDPHAPSVSSQTPPTTTSSAPSASAPTPSPALQASHEDHANVLSAVFSALERVAHVLDNPLVLELLPPKYRRYAAAAAAVEHEFVGQPDPADSTSTN